MAKFCIVGEAWGEQEALLCHPFVGPSGVELLRMLDDSGLMPLTDYDKAMIEEYWKDRNPVYTQMVWAEHPEAFLTNVFNLRPEKNDVESLCTGKAGVTHNLGAIRQGKYIRDEYLGEVERLRGELKSNPTNLILALGNSATWALLGVGGISKIRGTVTSSEFTGAYRKVLPVLHPAAILRQWELRAVTVLDLKKAAREIAYPEVRRPQRTVYIEPTLEDLEVYYDRELAGASIISFDIETAAHQITCIGFAPSERSALVVPFTDQRRDGGSYWPTAAEELSAWNFVRRVLDHPAPKVGQNLLYDLHFLWRGYGITARNVEHDTMLLHHSLQPESPKGLGFLGSVYTNEASWKLMRDRGKKTLKREDT